MSAAGRVCTGFSYPFVGKYGCSGDTVTFTEGMELARGVDVSMDIQTSEENDFYANNGVAESDSARFVGGTLNLTVDGLHPAAEKMISGLPAPTPMTFGLSEPVNVTCYGEDAEPPYLGVGYIARYQSDGVEIFVPTIILKAKFAPVSKSAKTQEKDKDWQTQKLAAKMHRDDTAHHRWKWELDDQATEAAALELLKKAIGAVGGAKH